VSGRGRIRGAGVGAWLCALAVLLGSIAVLASKMRAGASPLALLAGLSFMSVGFLPLLRMRVFR
jgi:Na+-translocating ferredoxin:NAD+ oxidoreductase RnfD subunit